MMSSPTKRFQEWTGAVRSFFKMGASGASTKGAAPTSALAPREPSEQRQLPNSQSREPDHNKIEETFGRVDTESNDVMKTVEEQMEEAKEMYPGSKNWARDEERLFEILYLRQDIPMLPRHWTVDFGGVPIPEEIFETTKEHPPRIYAHSKAGSKEFTATAALTRLIDLTLSIRTLLESEDPDHLLGQKLMRRQAAELIKETLDGYLTWASRDGGYHNPRVVPNIAVEVVDADTQEGIVSFMVDRMKALGRLQREYYRHNRKPSFWSHVDSWIMATQAKKRKALKDKRRARNARRKFANRRVTGLQREWDELSPESTSLETPVQDRHAVAKRRRTLNGSPSADHDELGDYDTPKPSIESDTEPITTGVTVKKELSPTPDLNALPPSDLSPEPPKQTFRRQPPVVYGLYVIGTSVFVLTMDSSKGDAGYVSFHVDINFADNHQSIWNALTVALVVCAARDEMMLRLEDFDLVPVEEIESDPDA